MAIVSDKIAEHRKDYGFSVVELAELAGIPSKRLAEIEQGSLPSLYEATAIARALAIEPRLLLSSTDVPDAKRSVARFRAPVGVSSISAHDIRLLAKAAEVSRICAYLLGEVGREQSPVALARRVLPVRSHPDAWRQGYELAEQAREKLIPGGQPIKSVQASFESLAIHIAFVNFESPDIEAASLYESGACPVVLLNERLERVRREISRRAILAHELCHLLHDGGERDLLASISRDEDHAPVEMRANGFGPNFLAPGRYISLQGEEAKVKVLQLAETWGFTYEGAIWHAKNTRLIAPEDAARLLNEKRLPDVQPPFESSVPRTRTDALCDGRDVSPLVRGLASDLTMRAYAEGIITAGRGKEILTLA